MKKSIMQNKNRISDLLIKCISAISALQIFSLKDACCFYFPKFTIFHICNSSANCWLDAILFQWKDHLVYLKSLTGRVLKPLKGFVSNNCHPKPELISIIFLIHWSCSPRKSLIISISQIMLEQALSKLLWQIYVKPPVFLKGCFLSLIVVNGTQAL